MDPERFIQLSKYHKWDYISSPHLLLEENQVQEIKSSYGSIYKFRETNKDNLFICDGKGEELYNVGKYILDLPNVGAEQKYLITSKMQKNLMIEDFKVQRFKDKLISVVDEFAALRISMDKKEFNEINDSLKRALMGRSANVHLLMALQRAETSVIDG